MPPQLPYRTCFAAPAIAASWHRPLVAICVLLASVAQPLSADVPRNQYYLAYDFLEDGQTGEAAQGFELELRSLNVQVNNAGLESIPALVLLGECLYWQGDLSAAMERYDAGLMAAIRSAGWMARLQSAGKPAEKFEGALKGVQWWKRQREASTAAFPTRWPLVVGAPGTMIQLPSAQGVPAGGVVPVDALEILRTQAMALRRRQWILGPLARRSPLTPRLETFYAKSETAEPVLEAARAICHSLVLLAEGETGRAETQLRNALTLPGGVEHPLSPMAMMGLADIALSASDWKTAVRWLGEASLSAAEYEQFDLAAEALSSMAAIGAGMQDANLVTTLVQAANWSKNKSRLMALAAMCGAAQIQTSVAESNAATFLKQVESGLQSRDVVLPRIEAMLYHSMAQSAISRGETSAALKALDRALAITRGNRQLGSTARPLFQLQMTESLSRGKQLDATATTELLDKLLKGPDPATWMLEPCGALAWLTSDKQSSVQLWLDLHSRQSSPEVLLQCIDEAQRHRFWSSEAMGGRLLSLRLAFHDERLPTQGAIAALHKRFPGLTQQAQQIAAQRRFLRQAPLELDSRKWPEDLRKQWQSFQQLCERQENALWGLAISRESFPTHFPPPLRVESLAGHLKESDGILAFHMIDGKWMGFWVHKGMVASWPVPESASVESELAMLIKHVGVGQTTPHATEGWKEKRWTAHADRLSQILIPENMRAVIHSVERLLIVPSGILWYLPFELLPLGQPMGPERWLTRHTIAYFPTVGLCSWANQRPPKIDRSLGVWKPGFFSTDDRLDRQWANNLLASSPKTSECNTQAPAAKYQSSRWGRLQFDRAWVAAPLTLRNIATLYPLAYDMGNTDGYLANWLLLPFPVSQELVLPAFESSVSSGRLGDGADLFELACVLMAANTQSALVGRWSVRGPSTGQAMQEYVRNLEFENPSSAWRRAVFSMWADRFESELEPGLGNQNKGAAVQSGEEPFFWSGYMPIGDSAPR